MRFNPSLSALLLRVLIGFATLSLNHSLLAQCCTYTLNMHDMYGDGWNGGYLTVTINGNLIGNFAGSGFGSKASIPFCQGDQIQLTYTPGDYENENTYELFTSGWNLVIEDGPNPTVGDVFLLTGDCSAMPVAGNHPCSAIPMDTVNCVVADNSDLIGSGIHPGCAEYNGGDMWFVIKAPPSGNISFETDSGSIGDTGLAVWTDSECANIRLLGCDDDAGDESFSYLSLYDLNPNQDLYVQVFGYGGAKGSFRLCAKDLGAITLDSSELPIISINTLGQAIGAETKINALMQIRYNGPGQMTYMTDAPDVYDGHIGIEIRGASSSGYPQRPYGLETRLEDGTDNNVSLLDMPAESDWVLISNFNDRSLVRNLLALRLSQDMGEYSPRARLAEVVIDSLYKGIYMFGEKIKRDKNRVDIAKLDTMDNEGDQLTGGYILQQNYWSPETRFQSNFSPIDHPGFDVHFVYEFPKPDEITDAQKIYISSYVDSLETALYSDDFKDPDTGYRKYLDVHSFIHYFLVNELARNNDGFKKSVFLNKDRFSKGGKMKAGPIWDFDWAWKNIYGCFTSDAIDGSQWAHHVNDCPTDNYGHGWYVRMLQDSTFTEELRCTYEEYRTTIFDTTYMFAYIDSVGASVQEAQARHFKKWPILGVSGPAPEVGAVAQTYAAELDTLKSWITLRLKWLDENIPGLCPFMTSTDNNQSNEDVFRFYPNPSYDLIHAEGNLHGDRSAELIIFTADGRVVERRSVNSNSLSFDIDLKEKGIYFFTLSDGSGLKQFGKLIRL